MNRRSTILVLLVGALCSGCVAIPVERAPALGCADAPAPGGRYPDSDYCGRDHLVLGLFPAVGEARLNDLSTKGMPLDTTRSLLDLTVFPVIMGVVNFTGGGLPTVFAWIFEWPLAFDQHPGACPYMIVGYCKANRAIPRDDIIPPLGSEPVPGQ